MAIPFFKAPTKIQFSIGDAVDGLLAMTVVRQASKVSGGLDKGIRERMVMNVIIDVLIGITPILGDFADSVYQANTKNAKLLEKMLTKRVQKELDIAIAAEKERNAAPHRDHSPHSQLDGASSTDTLTDYDARHAGLHQRLQGRETPKRIETAQPAKKGKAGWMGKFTNSEQEAAPARPPRPAKDVVLAPEEPPRPNGSRHR